MKKKAPQSIIAIVHDFDGTLSPNNMQEDTIFEVYGINKDAFWKKADYLVEHAGYEPTLAYLKLLLQDDVFRQNPLKREDLVRLGAKIKYYPGVLEYFEHIQQVVQKIPEVLEWGIELEHYVISCGMKEILDGSKIVKRFKKIYACEYDYENGCAVFPKLVINDTNKTQFLFRINKGKLDLDESINEPMGEIDRRIPFRNMIYIGDSLTDIPSMSVVQKFGGHAIAVFDPSKGGSSKAVKMVAEKRADHFAPADFTSDSLLFKIVSLTLKKIIHTIAYYASSEMSLDWIKKNTK